MMPYPTRLIEGGNVSIGNDAFALSRPVHTIQLTPYRLMTGTVTNQQYAQFVAAGGYRTEIGWTAMGWRWRQSKSDLMPAFWNDPSFNHPDQPIVGITWYEAVAFANWVSAESNQLWRLPTEIEWEAAAQSEGTGTIHTAMRGVQGTIPVIGQGYYAANGLWNMLGNVWEWCSTAWGRNWQQLDHSYPYQADDGRENGEGSFARIMRGGSWFDPIQEAHSSKRARYLPGSRASNIGFRLVQDITIV
ncbi:MAG: SUMF1/EgtB/PvdO family nonheme iron enzyme [Phototrophicaceae bacterium]